MGRWRQVLFISRKSLLLAKGNGVGIGLRRPGQSAPRIRKITMRDGSQNERSLRLQANTIPEQLLWRRSNGQCSRRIIIPSWVVV